MLFRYITSLDQLFIVLANNSQQFSIAHLVCTKISIAGGVL